MDFLENGLGYALYPYSASKKLNCSFYPLQEKAYTVRAFITNKEEKSSMLRELFIDI